MDFELSRVVDALPGLVWTALPDGQIDFLNERWRQYTGLSSQEASGWGWRTAIHPEDRAQLLDQWRSIVASGQPGETEARLRRFDAKYCWFRFRLSPLAEDSGKVIKWCGINSDIEDHKGNEPVNEAIEDRKRTEDALRASERSLQPIINTIPTTAGQHAPMVITSILTNDGFVMRECRKMKPGASFCFTLPSHPSESGPEVKP
jgi:PAS domain S-box-containing protein